MCAGNSLTNKRKGLITRKRNTIKGIEESIIDFVITSNDLVENIEHIEIDDERINVLTKNKKTKVGSDYSESDHNLINTQFKITWNGKECKVIEVFMFKDEKAK